MNQRLLYALAALAAIVLGLALTVRQMCACSTVRGSYYIVLTVDLRLVAEAQAKHYQAHQRFARTLEEVNAQGFEASRDVFVRLEAIGDTAWWAHTTHPQIPEVTCRIEGGISRDGTTLTPRATEPACIPPLRRR